VADTETETVCAKIIPIRYKKVKFTFTKVNHKLLERADVEPLYESLPYELVMSIACLL